MKKTFAYILILSLLILTGCSDDRLVSEKVVNSDANSVTISSRCVTMNPVNVGTKATQKELDETKVTIQHLFIFGTDGKLLKVKNGVNNYRSESFQTSYTGTFIINRTNWSEDAKANGARLYVLANVNIDDFIEISTKANGQLDINENDLLNHCASTYNASAKFDPNVGMPMFGKYDGTLDLRNGNVQAEQYSITLIPLLARIDVKINFKPTDKNPTNAQFPAFQLINYDILNVPKAVQLREPSGDTPVVETVNIKGQANGAKTMLRDQSTTFTFYVGEYWRSATSNWENLEGIPTNFGSMVESEQLKYKQKNKNRIAPDDALKLVLHGIYTTPEGQGLSVDYTICLGGNLTDDFTIKRNYIYKNVFDIKGYVERENGTNGIEVDHRVNLEYQKYYIQSERRTEIDCHWEMRPVDISVTNPNTVVTAEIVEDPDTHNYPTWMGIEQKMTDTGDAYLNGGNGRRKYFTRSLVSELNNTGRRFTLTTDNNRLWLYFDENTEVSETGSRQCTVKFTFEDEQGTEEVNMVFVQHDACPVEFTGSDGTTYKYVMETHEEYLYNFDPKDNYGVVTEGMPWGYDGKQISKSYKAISDFKSWLSSNEVDIARLSNAYYDFDNRSNAPFQSRTYSGKEFTKELIHLDGADYSTPAANGVPRSAAEYCYNKNYRESGGTVSDENYEWYLPAVDEIEPLLKSGFNSFPELQDNYYWSSQPSYLYMDVLVERSRYFLEGLLGREKFEGTAFIDDVENARATKITKTSSPMEVANSTKSSTEGQIYVHLNANNSLESWSYRYNKNGQKVNCDPPHSLAQITRTNTGPNLPNQPRTAINRVRCVRRISPAPQQ